MDAEKTGSFLAALRKSKGYTQQEVADLLNLSNKTISKWEAGGGFPDITVLPVLSELYAVTTDDILAGECHGRADSLVRAERVETRLQYLTNRAELQFMICYSIATVAVLSGYLWELYTLNIGGPLLTVAGVLVLLIGFMLFCGSMRGSDNLLGWERLVTVRKRVGQRALLFTTLLVMPLQLFLEIVVGNDTFYLLQIVTFLLPVSVWYGLDRQLMQGERLLTKGCVVIYMVGLTIAAISRMLCWIVGRWPALYWLRPDKFTGWPYQFSYGDWLTLTGVLCAVGMLAVCLLRNKATKTPTMNLQEQSKDGGHTDFSN
jgi:transcriptional regulator with XRE-family HTH domain